MTDSASRWDAARWERAVAIFEAARERTGNDRDRYVDEVTGDDAELRARIVAMLAADDATHPVIDAIPDAIALAAAGGSPDASLIGQRIGPYTLIEEVGRGGMGAVYLADRDDVGRRVALKLVAGGIASHGRVDRFLVERFVLAQLEHPWIARLYDAGIATDGTPWLAMEYVDGVPIDRWFDEQRLDTSARLAFMADVCDAVAYAHRNLVVHRDLKPSNIMVTKAGEPRLVDFGIAKLLDHTGDDGTITRGAHPLTPRYASPEQLAGGPITTASDVYQLGVIMRELVTDRRPNGEVEAMIGMALRPEPERRYASAQQLADDIRRYLDGQPVVARPDTLGYRAGKFVRRNRVAVGAAAALVLGLFGATIVTASQARRAAIERDRATAEAAKVEQVAAFLTDIFSASQPTESLGREVTARELLDRGAERLRDHELEAQPLVRAELLDVLGNVYMNLGWRVEARELLTEGLTLRRQHLSPDDPDIVESLVNLGTLEVYDDRPTDGLPILEEALTITRSVRERNDAEVARLLQLLAGLHMRAAAFDTAESLQREAIALRRAAALEDEELASGLHALANILSRKGNLEAADTFGIQTLEIRRRTLAPNHPELGRTLNNIGTNRLRMRDYAGAEPYLREALEIWQDVLGRHPDVAVAMNNLGSCLESLERFEEAEQMYRGSLELKYEFITGDHSTIASSLNNLGLLLVKMDRYDDAEPLLVDGLAMRRRLRGDDHPDTAIAEHSLASLHERRGNRGSARDGYNRAYTIRRKHLGEDHALTVVSRTALARVTEP